MLWKTSLTVSEGRVTEIGTAAPKNAARLELSGFWLSPGLVDMHAHVTFEPRAHYDEIPFDYGDDSLSSVTRGIRNLTEASRLGICLVRDMGGREAVTREVRNIANSGEFNLPETVTSGEPLCLPNGHGSSFGRVFCADSEPEIRDYFRSHRDAGHEWLKIMNGPELWDASHLRFLIGIARSEGLRTAVHAFTPKGIRDGVHAGANTIEHALVFEESLIDAVQANGTVFVPTHYCSWLSLRPRFTWTQSEVEVGHLEYWRALLLDSRIIHQTSAALTLPGTDAGCSPCTFDDYLHELEQFKLWGMSEIQVLTAASADAAQTLGRSDDFGSVTVGKWANIIITEKSPLDSLSHLRDPELILLKGVDVVNHLGERWK